MRYMPARNPDVTARSCGVADAPSVSAPLPLPRRQECRASPCTRIEAGSAAVTIGAYLNAAGALDMQLTLGPQHFPPPSPAREAPHAPTAPATVRVGDYPQLQTIAWQLRAETELSGIDALHLYERNWRHLDQSAMSAEERALVPL